MNISRYIRKNNPLIHHLTNQVVMNFSANGLLALGASPIMAKERSEVAEISNVADGVLINIGTLIESEVQSMLIAGKMANERSIPVVLDPVGVAATTFRQQSIEKLIKEIRFTAIKGNAGEMAYFVNEKWKTKGVDSSESDVEKLKEIALEVAKKYKTIAMITGETDIVSDGNEVYVNETGSPLLTKITGAGCLLGSVLTTYLTVDYKQLNVSYEAVKQFGLAAQRAEQKGQVNGPGTFKVHLIDEMARM